MNRYPHRDLCRCDICEGRREVDALLREAEAPVRALDDDLLALAAMTTKAADAQQEVEDLACSLLNQRRRIALVLERFYSAELSMSSVQPVLDLALELNPHLRKER